MEEGGINRCKVVHVGIARLFILGRCGCSSATSRKLIIIIVGSTLTTLLALFRRGGKERNVVFNLIPGINVITTIEIELGKFVVCRDGFLSDTESRRGGDGIDVPLIVVDESCLCNSSFKKKRASGGGT